MGPSNMDEIKQVTLEKMRFGIQSLITEDLLVDMNQVELLSFFEHRTNEMVFSLRMTLMGQRLKEIRVSYPTNWKESIKERFAPKWFLKNHPVKYTKVELTASAVYPLIALPDEKHFVQFKMRDWEGQGND